MSDFVICIDDDWGWESKRLVDQFKGSLPTKGTVYTVRGVVTIGYDSGYLLEEIVNPPVYKGPLGTLIEPVFITTQFRPVKDSDLDVFREMLNDHSNMDGEVITTD